MADGLTWNDIAIGGPFSEDETSESEESTFDEACDRVCEENNLRMVGNGPAFSPKIFWRPDGSAVLPFHRDYPLFVARDRENISQSVFQLDVASDQLPDCDADDESEPGDEDDEEYEEE